MTASGWGSIAAAVFLAAAGTPTGAQNSSAIETSLRPFSADDIAAGSLQYKRTCAHCHGRTRVNSGTTRHDLQRFPVDRVDRFLVSATTGKSNMPSFEIALTSEQIKVLWAYVGSRRSKWP